MGRLSHPSRRRSYRTKDGRTVYVLRKMVAGRNYAITLDARRETEAEAGLALLLRDPAEYRTRTETVRARSDVAVFLDSDTVGRFLEYLCAQKRTERYVRNVGFYLAGWAEALAGRDLRTVNQQEYLRELARHRPLTSSPRSAQRV